MFVTKSRLKTSKSTDSMLNGSSFSNNNHMYFIKERLISPLKNENLNRSQTANLIQNNGDLNQNRILNNRTFKEAHIEISESLQPDSSNINERKIDSQFQEDQIKSQFRMNQLNEAQSQSNEQNKKINSDDNINEQQMLIEWEQINFVDDQHDKIIDNLKFQVDSLTIKMESLTEDDLHLANEFVNQLDGCGKMNLVNSDLLFYLRKRIIGSAFYYIENFVNAKPCRNVFRKIENLRFYKKYPRTLASLILI
jgi:hypothetical protein